MSVGRLFAILGIVSVVAVATSMILAGGTRVSVTTIVAEDGGQVTLGGAGVCLAEDCCAGAGGPRFLDLVEDKVLCADGTTAPQGSCRCDRQHVDIDIPLLRLGREAEDTRP